jgi:hypothetical protein
MKVLIVDGPKAGEVMNPEGPDFKMPVPGKPDGVIYYAHRFWIFGQSLWIASIHLTIDDVSRAHVAAFILSDKAKEVLDDTVH